ncbi:MAG: hypothetical protein HONBIEJF_02392 [Fimbriimonadaceae bacterium]|nr:hypothetical protein [Fimbriimonadaceae bacterium]
MLWLAAGLSVYSAYVVVRALRDIRALREPAAHIEMLIRTKPLPELLQFVPGPPKFDPRLSSLPDPVLQGLHLSSVRKAYGEYQSVRRALETELARAKVRLDGVDQAFQNALDANSAESK